MNPISVKQTKRCNLEDFKKEYNDEVITEWLLAYISYESIQDYLKFLSLIYNDYHMKWRQNLEI